MGYIAEETSLRARLMPVYKRKDKSKEEIEYIPGYGNHTIKFNGQTLWVIHSLGETIVSGWDRTPKQQEWIDIYSWGNDSTNIKAFIDAAIMHKIKEDQEKVVIYQAHWCNWHRVRAKTPRALGSVILDGNNAQMLIDDMTTF